MTANISEQQSGCCQVEPGVNERIYAVGGETYRYRNYFKTLKMRWNPIDGMWFGKLTSGKVWFIKTKLGLEVRHLDGYSRPPKPSQQSEQIRLQKAPEHSHKPEGSETSWEAYSALPVKTKREAFVHPELNINLRDCFWGSELCQSCLECVSNIQENGDYPSPEIDFWDQEEEMIRNNATLLVVV